MTHSEHVQLSFGPPASGVECPRYPPAVRRPSRLYMFQEMPAQAEEHASEALTALLMYQGTDLVPDGKPQVGPADPKHKAAVSPD